MKRKFINLFRRLKDVVYLFELKMDEPVTGAIQQIKDKDYARKFKVIQKTVYGIGVSIDREKRKVTELEWEIL